MRAHRTGNDPLPGTAQRNATQRRQAVSAWSRRSCVGAGCARLVGLHFFSNAATLQPWPLPTQARQAHKEHGQARGHGVKQEQLPPLAAADPDAFPGLQHSSPG